MVKFIYSLNTFVNISNIDRIEVQFDQTYGNRLSIVIRETQFPTHTSKVERYNIPLTVFGHSSNPDYIKEFNKALTAFLSDPDCAVFDVFETQMNIKAEHQS